MTASLLINGVDAATLGLTLAEAPGWLDMPPRDVPTAPIIGRGGLKALADPVEGARQITLTSTTRSATATLTRTQIDNIKLALSANPLSLIFCDHSDRHVYATLKSFGVRTLQGASGPFVQEALGVEVVLTALDPLSYDNELAGVLQWYAPGDTITGESFSRSTTDTYYDGNGIVQTRPISTKADGHYPTLPQAGGLRSIQLEDTRINRIIWGHDLTNPAWTKRGTVAVSMTTTGPDGVPNSATSITGLGAPGVNDVFQSVSGFGANARFEPSLWIKKGSASGTVDLRNAQSVALGQWTINLALLSSAWEKITRRHPAVTIIADHLATAGGSGGSQLSCTAGAPVALSVWGATNEPGPFSSSTIPTAAVAVTRGADSYALPFTATPCAMTVYEKFVEGGTVSAIRYLFSISNATPDNPSLSVDVSAGVYRAAHGNGVSTVLSPLAVAPNIGDTVELAVRLFADGSVDITQSINGAAPTSSTRTAANALAPAWSGLLVWLNSGGTAGGSVGFTALQSFKAVAGVRSLDEMRAIVRMPLGTGPIRPLVTITGASTNPVISLYNKAGVVVASITLTITTVGGDVLAVDMDAKTVKKNGVSAISAISAGDFFSIDPADQANFGPPGPRIDSSSGATSVAYYRTWR